MWALLEKFLFDVIKNKKDLTFLSNVEHSQWEQKVFCFGCFWWDRYIFLFLFLFFKTRIKASCDFHYSFVFTTPRALRVDSAHNSRSKYLFGTRMQLPASGAVSALSSHGPPAGTYSQKNWEKTQLLWGQASHLWNVMVVSTSPGISTTLKVISNRSKYTASLLGTLV